MKRLNMCKLKILCIVCEYLNSGVWVWESTGEYENPYPDRNDEKFERVKRLGISDIRTMIEMIAKLLNMSVPSIFTIITEVYKVLCAHSMSYALTPERKEQRIFYYKDLGVMANQDQNWFQDPNCLQKVVTRSEFWCFGYDPETKSQNDEWINPGKNMPMKIWALKSKTETLLIKVSDSRWHR